jgi:thiol-disulfide isomerase/thioredoxin
MTSITRSGAIPPADVRGARLLFDGDGDLAHEFAGPPGEAPAHIELGLEGVLRSILLLLALPGLAACDRQKADGQHGEAAVAEAEQREGVDRSRKGKPAPETPFKDPDGGDISLADFRGVPTLVNLWASWCAPCVKELPTLQKLEEAQAVDGQLGVIAVSQDMAPKASVDAFLESKKIARFAAFHDSEMGLSGALGAQVLPTSVLFDAEGREVWRYVGDLDWTSEEAAKLLAEGRPGASR